MSLQTGSALTFDGSQNYVDCGAMGNFGSTISNGVYIAYRYKSTSTAFGCIAGAFNTTATTTAFQIFTNSDQNEANSAGKICAFIRQESGGNNLEGATTNAIANLNNGQWHDIAITLNGATNVITITVDGTSQAITYSAQNTPSTFTNLTRTCLVGARHVGVIDSFANCSIDNIKFATGTPGNLTFYGIFNFDEGVGTTTADTSSVGATGTLTGTPKPTWILGSSLPYAQNVQNRPILRPHPFSPGLAR